MLTVEKNYLAAWYKNLPNWRKLIINCCDKLINLASGGKLRYNRPIDERKSHQ